MVNLVQRGQNLGKESFLCELTNCKIHVFTTLLKGFYLSFVNIFFKNNPYLLNSMKGPLLGSLFYYSYCSISRRLVYEVIRYING